VFCQQTGQRIGGANGIAHLAENEELAARLDALEQRYDAQFQSVIEAIRRLSPRAGGRAGAGGSGSSGSPSTLFSPSLSTVP
jgi:hypothetical protein